jgi:DNA ligase D-like protein (predicted ligase)
MADFSTLPTHAPVDVARTNLKKTKAEFVEPMLLLRSESLPEGSDWLYELKLDGYRALAIKTDSTVRLRSRNDNDFASKYRLLPKALAAMPDETVLDGEVVALDASGRPSFNTLQNYSSPTAPIFYYVFDVLVLKGRTVMNETLDVRRALLRSEVLPKLQEPIRYAEELHGSVPELLKAVRAYGFEGLVAKRRDSVYEPGKRSGAWRKVRVNQGQEFVIGGYTVGGNPFDALVFGYYEGDDLIFVARTRNGFTPMLRRQLFAKMRKLETPVCPFANLPEKKSGRWGQGLTAEKMAECRWLKPVLVGQFEFVEWTPDNHLRHSRFIGLREDKDAPFVTRE